jgi:uncharacterized protein YdhG (YjbR/CyaY superfamily)
MIMSNFDELLADVAEPERKELERIRRVVRREVPSAEESVSYGMPAFKYKQRPLLGFKVSRNHLSVAPFSADVIDASRGALAGFDLSKGTVRFTPSRPLPVSAIKELLRHRIREIEGKV